MRVEHGLLVRSNASQFLRTNVDLTNRIGVPRAKTNYNWRPGIVLAAARIHSRGVE